MVSLGGFSFFFLFSRSENKLFAWYIQVETVLCCKLMMSRYVPVCSSSVRVPQHAFAQQCQNVELISCPDDLVFKQGNSLTWSQLCSIFSPRTAWQKVTIHPVVSVASSTGRMKRIGPESSATGRYWAKNLWASTYIPLGLSALHK